ncbi:MAG: glycoside hydrolase family 127 protein [Acidobacteria bacterium]|nr:glycoside hydrolase family 127 protein [Acidobacteriota bacterium]
MTAKLVVCLFAGSLVWAAPPERVILDLAKSPGAKLRNVPVSAVRLQGGFWEARRKTNVEKSIPTMLQLLEEHGVVDNFRRLSGRKQVARKGPLYTDSDLYKWMEAAAYVLQSEDRPELRAAFDRLTGEILAAQEPSGYLNTYYQDELKDKRFTEMHRGHELYCLGHLLQAAIAYYRATGERKLLDGGMRFADYLVRDFGPTKRPLLAGHPEIELALAELYRTTGKREYLNLAGYILHGDGERLNLSPQQLSYMFSGRPFTDRKIVEGHSVRAGYACSGAADYFLETGDPSFGKTLERLWTDMTQRKMYITGGIGSRSAGEAFGDPYELPNAKAYTESCAAIANMMFNWRMLAATGQARYTDVLEQALYNSVNSGMSLEGTLYCYRNPLELAGGPEERIRNPWYSTTCCPPNLERTFAMLPGYFYSTSGEGLFIHLYDNNDLDWKLEDGTALKLKVLTRYPWEGAADIALNVGRPAEFTLFLRIPGWSERTEVLVNGEPAASSPKPGEYLPLRRRWKAGDIVRVVFDMSPRLVAAHPRVMDNQGRAAVTRGPLVYCLEQPDQKDGAPVLESSFVLSGGAAKDFLPEFRADLLGGVTVLRHRGAASARPFSEIPLYQTLDRAERKPGKPIDLVLIPYYAFMNRGPAAMQVWIPYFRRAAMKM